MASQASRAGRAADRTAEKPEYSFASRISPGKVPRLCVSLSGPSVPELLARAERVARDHNLIELRLDALKAPQTAAAPLREFLRSYAQLMVIATCRKQTCGGAFKGSTEAELAILSDAARAGCAFVDLELQSAERLSARALLDLRRHATLMISYHDFKTTPALDALNERLRAIPADVYKIVTTAASWKHNLQMMKFLDANSGHQTLVGFCMGELGTPSRLLSLRAGGMFTYAALSADETTAPGQIELASLRDLYRVESINRATAVYGVLGYPLQHSLSPRMFNHAFRRGGMNAIYLPLPTRRPEEVLASADLIPFSGLSVTQPYKSAVMKRLEVKDALARAAGAVNTVVRSQGRLYGYNTDVAGIVEPLGAAVTLSGARILVLGAGGAARAAVFGLRARGAQVFIHNRTRSRAQALATAAKAKVVGRAELKKLEFKVVINATPVGQYPKIGETPLSAAEFHAEWLFDLVYNPLETALARMARAQGAQVIPGVEMFVHQGARQFEIWTGKPAPVDEMRREVLAALRGTQA